MKPLLQLLFSLLFVVGLGLTGCAPGDTATPAGDTDTTTFNFTGDFDGPLGIQLWSVREAMSQDVAGTLGEVYDMGFREVELAGTYGMSAADFRQMLDSVGLSATSMHVGYEMFRDSLESVLAQAKTLGVQYLGPAWIPHPEGPFSVETARQAAADFNRWGEAAAAEGLQFFYHNHGYEFEPAADGTIPFDVIVEETDPENVKFEMDVLWTARPGQDPAALLRKYPDRWVLMHVKDLREGESTNDFSGGIAPEGEVPVGQGQINFPEVLRAAEEIGVERYYIEDETTDPMGNIPVSTAYLETIMY